MENRLSDTESTQILDNWEFSGDSENVETISNQPKETEKESETRISEKEVDFTGGSKEESARRILPPWIHPSYEWGGGKWKEDGRKKKKKNRGKEKESEEIPFKDIIEALLRNSSEKIEEDDKSGTQSCVEMLKAIGFKFP